MVFVVATAVGAVLLGATLSIFVIFSFTLALYFPFPSVKHTYTTSSLSVAICSVTGLVNFFNSVMSFKHETI